ncbi:MAG TPA: hypothetical protein ACFYD4_06210 [Candidatus Wunengus sp. YC61]|uniref:hypothetical protein n=1 Tax=Candidatus Wunengus sp. YC61 TaxID=3367698 RepID=UPI004026DEB1
MKNIRYTRKPQRKAHEVKADIENSGKVVREDIYDVIKDTKTFQEAKDKVTAFLNDIQSPAIEYKGVKSTGIMRVVSDLKSYGIEWKE